MAVSVERSGSRDGDKVLNHGKIQDQDYTIATVHCMASLVLPLQVDHPTSDILDEVETIIIMLSRIPSYAEGFT